jgi:hypothetical protein
MENPIQTPDDQHDRDKLTKLVDPCCPVDDIWCLPKHIVFKTWRGQTARWFNQDDFTCTERAEYDFINHHDPKPNESKEYIAEYSRLFQISENAAKTTELEWEWHNENI